MARSRSLAKKEAPEVARLEPWDIFREMDRMWDRMVRDFFSSPFSLMRHSLGLRSEVVGFTPEVNLRETEKEFVMSVALPGMDKEDIDIDVTADRITISGERKTEEEKPGEQYHIRQQAYGSFNVSYTLPAEIKPNEVKANYKNGVLEVTMPKAEVKEAQKVKIEG